MTDGDISFQTWVCPICYDDHRYPDDGRPRCKLEDLEQMRKELNEAKRKFKGVIEYCLPNYQYMWAASVASEILDCGFRDTRQEMVKYLEKNK